MKSKKRVALTPSTPHTAKKKRPAASSLSSPKIAKMDKSKRGPAYEQYVAQELESDGNAGFTSAPDVVVKLPNGEKILIEVKTKKGGGPVDGRQICYHFCPERREWILSNKENHPPEFVRILPISLPEDFKYMRLNNVPVDLIAMQYDKNKIKYLVLKHFPTSNKDCSGVYRLDMTAPSGDGKIADFVATDPKGIWVKIRRKADGYDANGDRVYKVVANPQINPYALPVTSMKLAQFLGFLKDTM
jgi:hypothetical protein